MAVKEGVVEEGHQDANAGSISVQTLQQRSRFAK